MSRPLTRGVSRHNGRRGCRDGQSRSGSPWLPRPPAPPSERPTGAARTARARGKERRPGAEIGCPAPVHWQHGPATRDRGGYAARSDEDAQPQRAGRGSRKSGPEADGRSSQAAAFPAPAASPGAPTSGGGQTETRTRLETNRPTARRAPAGGRLLDPGGPRAAAGYLFAKSRF